MVISEIVEMYKGLEKPTEVDEFFTWFCNDSEEFSKYRTDDIEETFRYLKRRKELLEIVNTKNNGWAFISKHMDLPLDFIAEFRTKIYWKDVSYNLPYDEEFLDEFADKVDWRVLFLKYTFNEAFLHKHQDHIRSAIIREYC